MTEDDDFGGEDDIGAGYESYCRATEPVDDTPWEGPDWDPLGYGLYKWARDAAEAEQPRLLEEYGRQEDLDNPDRLMIESTLHEITGVWQTLHQFGCTYLLPEFCRFMHERPRKQRPRNTALEADIRALDRDPNPGKLEAALQAIADKHKLAVGTVKERRSSLRKERKRALKRAEENKQRLEKWLRAGQG
jgi:hypothetical protein